MQQIPEPCGNVHVDIADQLVSVKSSRRNPISFFSFDDNSKAAIRRQLANNFRDAYHNEARFIQQNSLGMDVNCLAYLSEEWSVLKVTFGATNIFITPQELAFDAYFNDGKIVFVRIYKVLNYHDPELHTLHKLVDEPVDPLEAPPPPEAKVKVVEQGRGGVQHVLTTL